MARWLEILVFTEVPTMRIAMPLALLVLTLAVAPSTSSQLLPWDYENCEHGCMKCAGYTTTFSVCRAVNGENGECNCRTHSAGLGRVCVTGGEACYGIVVEAPPCTN